MPGSFQVARPGGILSVSGVSSQVCSCGPRVCIRISVALLLGSEDNTVSGTDPATAVSWPGRPVGAVRQVVGSADLQRFLSVSIVWAHWAALQRDKPLHLSDVNHVRI